MKINVNTQSDDADHGINEPYPFWQVWLAYAFIGPMLGAALLSLPTLFLLLLFPLTWIITLFVGVPPAAVCGLWLACAQVWRTQYGLIYAGVVGAGCTVLWLILITGLQLSFDEQGKFEFQSLTMLLFRRAMCRAVRAVFLAARAGRNRTNGAAGAAETAEKILKLVFGSG